MVPIRSSSRVAPGGARVLFSNPLCPAIRVRAYLAIPEVEGCQKFLQMRLNLMKKSIHVIGFLTEIEPDLRFPAGKTRQKGGV
jgi:hypothetical protein